MSTVLGLLLLGWLMLKSMRNPWSALVGGLFLGVLFVAAVAGELS